MSRRSVYSNRDGYGLPKYRFMELYYFALQYKSWKSELSTLDGMRSVRYDTTGSSGNYGDGQVFWIAERRTRLEKKISLIEQCARAAGSIGQGYDISRFILLGVTDAGATYEHMYACLDIPCGKNTYYKFRKIFYFLLDKELSEIE